MLLALSVGVLIVVGIAPGGIALAFMIYRVCPYRGVAFTQSEAVIVRCGVTRAQPNAVLARAPRDEITTVARAITVGGVTINVSKRGMGAIRALVGRERHAAA